MNNSIKLRAWDRNLKEMVEVVSVDLENKFIRGLSQVEDNVDLESSYSFDEIELMQFSGLKDKNGTEIYEGDLLRRGDFNEENPSFIVRQGQFTDSPDGYYKNEYMGWYVDELTKSIISPDERTSLVYVIGMLDGIVCGNIYENPELLERDEDE